MLRLVRFVGEGKLVGDHPSNSCAVGALGVQNERDIVDWLYKGKLTAQPIEKDDLSYNM